jgi:hypothetical protein
MLADKRHSNRSGNVNEPPSNSNLIGWSPATWRLPTGKIVSASSVSSARFEMSGEYVLVSLRSVPLVEEGVYQFQVALRGQSPAVIDVPVFATARGDRPHTIN